MISVKNLCKAFGNIKALNNVSFYLKKGDITALLGPNGAGKTTLMRILTGYVTADSGEVSVADYKIPQNLLLALKHTGYVPENNPLYGDMSVYEFLKYIGKLHKLKKEVLDEHICFCISQLSLKEVINQKIETLSKGYKKRVAIAAALIHHPKVLILDEPTEGLDPIQKNQIRDFIKNYGKDNIVIISTHIMEEVEAMANRVLLINNGHIIRDTTPETLKKLNAKQNIGDAFLEIIQDS